MYGLVGVLETRYPNFRTLKDRWETFVQKMAKNSVAVFYEGAGKIRTVTKLSDPKKPVSENTYTRDQADCSFSSACYLDDPYEGEMFAMMMTLFAKFPSP